jgi:ATP synthase I subunit
MMPGSDPGSYARFIRRVQWIILALGVAGAVGLSLSRGIRTGLAFLVGAAISFSSFWGWQRVVDGLGPNPRQRGRMFFVLRLIALVGLAWVIIKYLQLNVAAAAMGLLVSGAAVVLELIYEMIYAS